MELTKAMARVGPARAMFARAKKGQITLRGRLEWADATDAKLPNLNALAPIKDRWPAWPQYTTNLRDYWNAQALTEGGDEWGARHG